MLRFFKMQGCGNDYVFIDCRSQTVDEPAGLARRISDRHTGIGSDGLVLLSPAEGADLAMRIFNADGSEAEMCGNAIRCAARYAWDSDWARHEPLRILTAAGLRVRNSFHQRAARGIEQRLCFGRDVAARKRPRVVAVKPGEVRAHVDADDVALLQNAMSGYAVDDLIVD